MLNKYSYSYSTSYSNFKPTIETATTWQKNGNEGEKGVEEVVYTVFFEGRCPSSLSLVYQRSNNKNSQPNNNYRRGNEMVVIFIIIIIFIIV